MPCPSLQAVALCEALEERGEGSELVPAADIADVTSSALAAIASEEVCAAYCAAIVSVCWLSEVNCAACGIGVVTAVLAMMETHPASADVQGQACEALNELADNAHSAAHMRADGRAEALLQKAKATHPDVQDRADRAISSLVRAQRRKYVFLICSIV